MRKYWICLTIYLLSVMTLSSPGFTATKTYIVELPKLKVSINGVALQNSYRNYPVVMYNNIPYFPLTYNDARHLGIEAKKETKGLLIHQTHISAGLRTDIRPTINPQKEQATKATYDIYINGKLMSQNDKNAPFLIHRNVPYIPMKQHPISARLGLKCTLSSKEGIQITSPNPIPKLVPIKAYQNGDLAIAKGYAYFFSENHNIIQVLASEPSIVKNTYAFPLDNEYIKASSQLNNEGGHILLTSKSARELFYQINGEGPMEKAEVNLGDIVIQLNYRDYYDIHNLTIKRNGEAFKPAGQPHYVYGMSFEHHEGEWSKSAGVPDYYRRGQDLYILAADLTLKEEYSRIYKVDLDTNQLTRISDEPVKNFKMEGSSVYFFTDNGLRTINIITKDKKDYKIIGKGRNLIVLGGKVYYINTQDGELYVLEGNVCKPINPGSKVIDLKMQNNYVVCSFEETPKNPYRMMIFNLFGKTVYKTSDVVDMGTISLDFNVLYYVESKSHLIYSIIMKE